jgi:hypothetical protein
MLHVFHLNVAYIAMAIHVCCKYIFKCFICFRRMLQVFIWMLHMFKLLYTYVASVYLKYFICFRPKLQVFYLDVAVVIHICSKRIL